MGQDEYRLKSLADDELLAGLSRIVGTRNRITAECLAYLAEVDERQIFLDLGFASLFECIRPAKAGVELRLQNCPVLRQKHVDLVSRRRVESRQHVRQIRKGIDFVGNAGGHDRVEGSEIFARFLVAGKQE